MKISDLVNLYFDGMNWTFIIHVHCLPNYISLFTGNHGKGSFNNYVDRILPFCDPPAWTKTDIF